MITNLSQQASIANQYLAELRDEQIQQDRMRFRKNLERLGMLIGFELSKGLQYADQQVQTPLGEASVALPNDRMVVASILRAGLPLHEGLLNCFDRAENAFISAYRKHHRDGSFDIKVEYVSCPDLADCTLIVADPMLATGASMVLSVQALLEHGTPKEIHLVTVIAAQQGVEYVRRNLPKAHLWVGAIDEELTAKSYIVPGLGDAGDLSFGPKVQE